MMNIEPFLDALLLETMFNQWLVAMGGYSIDSYFYRTWAKKVFTTRMTNLLTKGAS